MTIENILFSFKGRIDLKSFWIANIALALVYWLIAIVLHVTGLEDSDSPLTAAIFLPLFICALWIALAVAAKRLHDVDCPLWYYFVPFLNIYALIMMCFVPGTDGANKFGPPPLGGSPLAVAA